MLRLATALVAGATFVVVTGVSAGASASNRTKAEILSCAGAPHHVERRGRVEYLYYRSEVQTDALSSGEAASAKDEECETVVVLVNGWSATAEHRTSPNLLHAQLCAPQVNQCLQ